MPALTAERDTVTSRPLSTVEEIAELVRLKPETIRQMAREGRLPAHKVGKVWRFDPAEVQACLALPTASYGPVNPAAEDVSELALPLYESEGTDQNGVAFKDPAFSENRNEPVHRWVPWVAGFSSGFVGDCLREYLADIEPSNALILDPFAGVGTTLVESFRRGFNAVGFEINPYAALATRAKLEAADVSVPALEIWTKSFRHFMQITADEVPDPDIAPAGFRSRIPFFSPRIRDQVLWALRFIDCTGDPKLKDLFLVAFGSVMVKFSNYTYEPSLASRPGSGKPLIEHADVAAIVSSKLLEIASDSRFLQEHTRHLPRHLRREVIPDTVFNAGSYLDPESVDLAITSPPYLNNYHYVRNTRPHLFWLRFIESSTDLHEIEHASFGKFWQTVRDGECIELDFELPELRALLRELREVNPDKGVYGGAGWANYAAQYFNDSNRFCRVMAELTKPGGRLVVVIGNSILQGIELKVEEFLAQIAEQHGFEREAVHVLRRKRVGNSIIRSSVRNAAGSAVSLYEVALVLRKS